MKTKIILASIVYFGICVLVFEACCKRKCNDVSNPDCENYDPCYGKKVSVDFGFRKPVWNDITDRFFWTKEYERYTDTVIFGNGIDFDYFGDSLPSNKYKWQFEGMTQTFNEKALRNVGFSNYYNLPSNWTDTNYNFTKPLQVSLTVNTAPNQCVSFNDTQVTKTKQITFANKPNWVGRFVGTFSTNPSMIDTIYIGYKGSGGLWYLVNFPFLADSTATWYPFYSNDSATKLYYSLYHADWNLEQFTDNVGGIQTPKFERYKGVRSFYFKSTFLKIENRYPVEFTYQFEKFVGAPIETITFKGEKIFN
jgi:hypothetical protein